jgi:hypothetical protein
MAGGAITTLGRLPHGIVGNRSRIAGWCRLKLLMVLVATCVLVLTGCTGDAEPQGDAPSASLSASASASPSPKPPKPPLSEARLEGLHQARIFVTSSTFAGKGAQPPQIMHFRPKCAEGACDVVLSGTMRYGEEPIADDHYIVRLINTGRSYQGTVTGFFARCNDNPDKDRWTFIIRLDKAQFVDGVWTATRWNGTWTRDADFGGACRPGKQRAVIRGKYEQS